MRHHSCLVLFAGIIGLSLTVSMCSDSFGAPSYPEPSEREMRQAIERAMVERGGTSDGPGQISVDNSLNGMTLGITAFEKLGCQPATQGSGYICSFYSQTKVSAHSNEGTSAGDRHAAAINQLLQAMMGGQEGIGETLTRRFLKQGDIWRMSIE